MQAVRSGPWKLFVPLKTFTRHPHLKKGAKSEPLLFNVATDISSTKNVAAANPKVVERLLAFAQKARADLGDAGRKGKGQRKIGTVENPRPQRMVRN